MNIGEFLNTLALTTNVDATELNTFIETNKDKLNFELPSEIASQIQSKIITVDSAKHNIDLKKHFFAQALNGTDARINQLVDEYQFDDDAKSVLMSEKSTMKKVEILALKLKEAYEKKASTSNPSKTASLETEIQNLNKQILDVKTSYENKIKGLHDEFENKNLDFSVKHFLSQKDYANIPDKDIAIDVAQRYLQSSFESKGVKLINRNNKPTLVRADDTQLDYMENNKQVDFNSFAEKVLAEKGLLKVSNSSTTNTAASSATTTIIKSPETVNTAMKEYYASQREKINS
jgi:hypothetical protein